MINVEEIRKIFEIECEKRGRSANDLARDDFGNYKNWEVHNAFYWFKLPAYITDKNKGDPFGYATIEENGEFKFSKNPPDLTTQVSCDPVYLDAQNATSIGTVLVYSAPGGAESYVTVKWYGKPPKHDAAVYAV